MSYVCMIQILDPSFASVSVHTFSFFVDLGLTLHLVLIGVGTSI